MALDCLKDKPKSNNVDLKERNQVYWRSRRGMLELELKLIPFVREHFDGLSEAEQRAYERMLDEDDWQIFGLVAGARPAGRRGAAQSDRSNRHNRRRGLSAGDGARGLQGGAAA